jgi:hypothetical protein
MHDIEYDRSKEKKDMLSGKRNGYYFTAAGKEKRIVLCEYVASIKICFYNSFAHYFYIVILFLLMVCTKFRTLMQISIISRLRS